MDNLLVQPDPGLFIWTILTFLVLLGLLAKFAWRPLLQALDRRQEMIRQSLDDAEQAKQELNRIQQTSADIITKAKAQADDIITNTRSDAAKLREKLRQQAQTEAQATVRNAEHQIQLETERALTQIRQQVVDLSLMIASKLIRRNLTKADNEALIDEALRQVEAQQTQ